MVEEDGVCDESFIVSEEFPIDEVSLLVEESLFEGSTVELLLVVVLILLLLLVALIEEELIDKSEYCFCGEHPGINSNKPNKINFNFIYPPNNSSNM